MPAAHAAPGAAAAELHPSAASPTPARVFLPAAVFLALVAADSARPATPRPADGAAAWTTVLAFDEVRVEVDTAHLGGAGPVSAWARWTFASRAVSPTAWDAGVRRTVDAMEVDCAARAARTLASTAYSADGGALDVEAVADVDAAWRRPVPASVGGMLVAAVCRLAAH